MKIVKMIFLGIMLLLVGIVVGQSGAQSWKIWEVYNPGFSGVKVYKVQDGKCSLYVAYSDNEKGGDAYSDNGKGGDNVALATGQGCQ